MRHRFHSDSGTGAAVFFPIFGGGCNRRDRHGYAQGRRVARFSSQVSAASPSPFQIVSLTLILMRAGKRAGEHIYTERARERE